MTLAQHLAACDQRTESIQDTLRDIKETTSQTGDMIGQSMREQRVLESTVHDHIAKVRAQRTSWQQVRELMFFAAAVAGWTYAIIEFLRP